MAPRGPESAVLRSSGSVLEASSLWHWSLRTPLCSSGSSWTEELSLLSALLFSLKCQLRPSQPTGYRQYLNFSPPSAVWANPFKKQLEGTRPRSWESGGGQSRGSRTSSCSSIAFAIRKQREREVHKCLLLLYSAQDSLPGKCSHP